MLPLTALNDMNVMIASPLYEGGKPNYITSLYGFAANLSRAGLETTLHALSESLITRARARLLNRFLNSNSGSGRPYTHLLFWDGDVGCVHEQVCRLLLADKDVVAAAYPLKRYELPQDMPEQTRDEFYARYIVYPMTQTLRPDAEGFCEYDEVTSGMLCIRRRVFDEMIAAYSDEWYYPENDPDTPHWLFFDTMFDKPSRRYLSEDYAFCRRWRDIGGKIHLDFFSRLTHCGQHVFKGDLKAHLEASKPKPKIIMPGNGR